MKQQQFKSNSEGVSSRADASKSPIDSLDLDISLMHDSVRLSKMKQNKRYINNNSELSTFMN